MESFSSYLELMAAFNFAYVLGQDYLKEILLKGLGISDRIKIITNDRIAELNAICDTIKNESSTKDSDDGRLAIANAVSKIQNDVIASLNELKLRYKLDMSASIPIGFPQMCLIAGILCMYTILVVGCNGSDVFLSNAKYSVICHTFFSIFVLFLYVSFLALTLIPKMNRWAITYEKFVPINATLCYLCLGVLLISYSIVALSPSVQSYFNSEIQSDLYLAVPECLTSEGGFFRQEFSISEYRINYTLFSYITILSVPIFHFLLFLLIASKKGKEYYKLFLKDFENIQNKFDKLRLEDDLIIAADQRRRESQGYGFR